MCVPQLLPLFAAGGGAAAAGGAAASAVTIGSVLQTAGAVAGVVGALSSGINSYNASKVQATEIERQKTVEARLNATDEQRSRQKFKSLFAEQRADLVARGVALDSPTAVFLGETAAREMVFEAQSIRQRGLATQAELTSQQRAVRARGRNALIKGGFSAADTLLTAAPEIWPELLA
jgi:hypothetical protein